MANTRKRYNILKREREDSGENTFGLNKEDVDLVGNEELDRKTIMEYLAVNASVFMGEHFDHVEFCYLPLPRRLGVNSPPILVLRIIQ